MDLFDYGQHTPDGDRFLDPSARAKTQTCNLAPAPDGADRECRP